MLDRDDETVIAVFPPDVVFDKMIEEADGRQLIEVTVENSPGWLGAKYKNGKFE